MSTLKMDDVRVSKPAQRPEALEFARSGRISQKYSPEEVRERFLRQTVLIMLSVAAMIAGLVIIFS
ncbi:MAG: hypothetical protein ACK50P_20040 [Planctomycetaceae bacterium]